MYKGTLIEFGIFRIPPFRWVFTGDDEIAGTGKGMLSYITVISDFIGRLVLPPSESDW